MFYLHGNALKPSLVLIEKWIASNENDNENLAHVVDNISSETNKDMISHNGERSVTGENSLPETFENNEDGIPVPENQQVTDDSALVLGINKSPKLSKSKHKSKKKDRHNRRSKNDLQSRVSSYLTDDLFSDQLDNTVTLQMNDEQVQGSSENLWRNISISDNNEEQRSKRIMPTATVTSHSLEESQAFYDEIVVEETPLNLSTDKSKMKQISVENGRWSHSFDRAEDFNGHFTGVKTNNVYQNYLDMVDNIQQNDHRSKTKCAEVQDQLPQPQFELVDDVDDDQPIDYSMSMRYHHQVRTDLDFSRNNLTILRTESRCVVSPAGFARTGLANTGFLPYPAHSYRDNQQKATRSDLHHPVAQQAFEQPSLSQYQHGPASDSVATNDVAEHSSGTKVETVDASTQTDIERLSDHSCDGKCYIKYMDNNNKFLLKLFNCCFSTMAVMANGGILNSTSPSFAGSSSQNQPRNTTSLSENRTNLPQQNVHYHEDNAHAEETQVANIRRGNKNGKKKKGIPKKRSQRLLDMAGKNEKGSQNADEAEVPTKKSKRDVNQEFEVEQLEVENVSNSSLTDDNSLEAAPRNISLSRISVSMETLTMTPIFPMTPKRPSEYQEKRKIKRKFLMKK